MIFKNKFTGAMVTAVCALAAQSFGRSPDWEAFDDTKTTPQNKSLNKMTTAELEAEAAAHGIDISTAKTNAERAAIIEAALQGGGGDD